MNHNNKEARPPITYEALDACNERLGRSVSILRSWASCPQMFDHINAADRQNLFLSLLDKMEAAQSLLAPPA